MAYEPIVNVNITITDVQLSVEGFGTPLFLTTHRSHENRVEVYTSAADVGAVYGTTSAAYRASVKAFGQSPKITTLKIGRRDGELRLVPESVADGVTYGFTVISKLGVSSIFSYTASGGDTAVEVSAALKAAIDLDADILLDVDATAVSSQITLASQPGVEAYFTVEDYVGDFSGSGIWRGTETAADAFRYVTEEDSDFYFITCDDNAVGFVTGTTGMAATVETVDKMYFLSDSNQANIGSVDDPDNSLFGQLLEDNLNNTVVLYHQDAGDSAISSSHEVSEYPEIAYVAANAVYDAGSVTWANLQLGLVGESRNTVNDRRLTPTQKGNLERRNANYIEYDAGVAYTREGKASGGEWIDNVRGVHWQKSDITVNLKQLLLGQKGGKVTYNDSGINRVREVIMSSLQRGVNREFLDNYVVNVPRRSEISTTQVITRILKDVTFEGVFAGAIHEVRVNGTVSSTLLPA